MSVLLAALAAAASMPCSLPPGWDMVEARRTRYVVVGEIHGSAEVPAFVGRIGCALATRGERVLVAIEQGSVDNDALQAIWAAPHARFAAILREYSGWKGRTDGVGSRAMFDMLVRLHRLRAQGRAIDIVAFAAAAEQRQQERFAKLPGQGSREAAQAENIRTAAGRKAYDRVLVLVGNVHARKRTIDSFGAPYEPMAHYLAPASEVTTLAVVDGGGSTWNCQLRAGLRIEPGKPLPSDAIECAVHPSKPMADLGAAPAIKPGDPPGLNAPGAYDGYVWIGPVTGSPPVDDAKPTP